MEVDPSGTGLRAIFSQCSGQYRKLHLCAAFSRHYQPSWPWSGGSHSRRVLNHILCCGQTRKNFGSFSLKRVSIHIKFIGQCSSAGLISWSTVLDITPSYMYHPTRIPLRSLEVLWQQHSPGASKIFRSIAAAWTTPRHSFVPESVWSHVLQSAQTSLFAHYLDVWWTLNLQWKHFLVHDICGRGLQ